MTAKRMRRGMTLIELVAAIVLTGIMAAAGTAAFSTILDHRELVRTSTVDVERAAAMREMLRNWTNAGTVQLQLGGGPRAAQTRAAASARNQQRLGGVLPATTTGDELTFTTTAPTPVMTSQTRVRLFIDDDESTPERGLTMEFQPATTSPLQRLELDSMITLMTVEILDRRTNRWYPYKEAATVQPMAVRVTFPPPEDGEPPPPLMQVPIIIRIGDPAAPVTGR